MKTVIWAALLVLTLSGCKKEVEELEPETQTGENTFGAKVDGMNWEPRGFGVVPTAPILEAYFAFPSSVRIHARNFASSPTETEFEILLYKITGPGTYSLDTTTQPYPNATASYARYIDRRVTPRHIWITNDTHTGSVVVTRYDVENKVISGTFSFRGEDTYAQGPAINVTEGRFDVRIQ